ncbi:B3 domain-containing transcription factor VRN1 [Linum perenne]
MNTPRFSKIVLDHQTSSEEKLHSANVNLQRIPKGFAAVHGAQLPNAVFLKLPSGAQQRVGVLRSGDTVWFDEGWREFSEILGLVPGLVLVFEYVNRSCFLVIAFDITGTEIDYPAQQANGNVELVKCEVDDDSDSAESLEMLLPSTKSSDKAPLIRSLHPSKLRRMTEMGRADTASGSTMVSRGLDAGMAKQRKMNVASGHLAGEHLQGHPSSMTSRKQLSVPEAEIDFTSNQPFFKIVVMRDHLSNSRLRIPQAFCEHVKEVPNEAELWVGGRCWGTRISRYSDGSKSRHRMHGLGPFAKGNSLKVGDVCAFELIENEDHDSNGERMVLSVHIFRG